MVKKYIEMNREKWAKRYRYEKKRNRNCYVTNQDRYILIF